MTFVDCSNSGHDVGRVREAEIGSVGFEVPLHESQKGSFVLILALFCIHAMQVMKRYEATRNSRLENSQVMIK